MRKICEPVELKNLSVENRLVRSATWEGIANPDGSITDESYASLNAAGISFCDNLRTIKSSL